MSEGYGERYESVVDQRIREAQERGAFDDLPGAGKPLTGLHGADDANWWLRGFLEREGLSKDTLLPAPLRLRKEHERLPEAVRDLPTEAAVRAVVGDYNRRVAAWVRNPTGPRVSVRSASVEEIVAGWRAERSTAPRRTPEVDEPGPQPERFRRRLRLRFRLRDR